MKTHLKKYTTTQEDIVQIHTVINIPKSNDIEAEADLILRPSAIRKPKTWTQFDSSMMKKLQRL